MILDRTAMIHAITIASIVNCC